MADVNAEDVEGIEADPEVLQHGEGDKDSAIGSDLDSTRSASITSSIVRQPTRVYTFLDMQIVCQRLLNLSDRVQVRERPTIPRVSKTEWMDPFEPKFHVNIV